MTVDDDARRRALEVPGVVVDDAAHAGEHSVEVHLPFLMAVLGDVPILPLVVGRSGAAVLGDVLDLLWGGSETAIVISTDLSHYLESHVASELDRRTAEAICRLEAPAPDAACGAAAVDGLLRAARRRDVEVRAARRSQLRRHVQRPGARRRLRSLHRVRGVIVGGYVDVRVYAELNDFLPPERRGTTMRRPFRSHQTVKDVVEAVGIPHTEVDLILVGGASVDFSHRPVSGDRLAVYPVFETLDIGPVGRLRPVPLREPRFVVDVNLGRLARLLRLVGFDVQYDRHLDDAALAAISDAERRILLTRDRGLLKRRQVTHGLFVRADRPFDQIIEVLRRLDLAGRLAPFTRCLRCGEVLVAVRKVDVLDRLEPLTRRHVDDFARCRGCGQLYWKGSHHRRLMELVERIVAELGQPADAAAVAASEATGAVSR